MTRRAVVLGLLTPIFLGGCLHAEGDEAAPEARRPLAFSREGRVGAPWIAGNRLHGIAAGRGALVLRGEINSTLIAGLAPGAVLDDRRGVVAYNSWRGQSPVLRIYDVRRRRDRVLAAGAVSAAWRRDGALAYFAALRPRVRTPRTYVGHLVVRRRLRAPAERWTRRPARYVAAAWAGRTLLAYRVGSGWPDLLALDGRGRVRLLAQDSALVALSSDGRSAFVAAYGRRPALARVLAVATGQEFARLEPGRGIEWISESGSWARERVFASSSRGLVVFRVARDAVELEDVIAVADAFPVGIAEPQADASGRRVTARGELPSQPRQAVPSAAVFECELQTRRCTIGPRVASFPGPRLVYDPSRP